jgi:hypothetical protein
MDGAICAAALAVTILVAEVTSVARKHFSAGADLGWNICRGALKYSERNF